MSVHKKKVKVQDVIASHIIQEAFVQRQTLNASLDYWQNKNSHNGLEQLVAKRFVWTYDAIPFPF